MKLQSLEAELTRPKRIGITGESGSGKTHKILEALLWARSQVEDPEHLQIVFIDCDDGLRPLINRGLLPEEIRKRIMYHLYYQDWNGIKSDILEVLPKLEENARKYGPHASLIVIDNGAKVWDWLHEDYCQDVYGMSRKEMMRDARKRALEENKKALPVLNQMLDYGVLNAEFFGLWDRIQFSNVSVIVTAPVWINKDRETGEVESVNMKGVNPELIHRLDEVFWVHTPDNASGETRVSSMIKRRTCSRKFSNVADLSFGNWMKYCEKYALDKPLEVPQ